MANHIPIKNKTLMKWFISQKNIYFPKLTQEETKL